MRQQMSKKIFLQYMFPTQAADIQMDNGLEI